MQARYVVEKAVGIDGPPIPEDEPCIVIRGQDVLALHILVTYIRMYLRIPNYDPNVVSELLDHAEHVIVWQATHATKVADR